MGGEVSSQKWFLMLSLCQNQQSFLFNFVNREMEASGHMLMDKNSGSIAMGLLV